MSMDEIHTGGCQCNAVRYQLRGPLPAAYCCHCGECKKQSASAFSMSIPLLFERLNVVGEVAVYVTRGFGGERKLACFCNQCGTRLWHRLAEDGMWVTLKVGTLDDAAGISPRGHLWVSKMQPWVVVPEDVPAFETQPDDVHAWRTSLE